MNFIKDIFTTGELELWRKQRQWNRLNHPLTYLFWEATVRCNFKCKHCGSAYETLGGDDELTTKEIKAAFSQISHDFNPKQIMVAVTGGEPTVRKDLLDVTTHISKLGFNWGMVTNGFLLDGRMAEGLKKSGMRTVVVSIDDIGKLHDEFRGIEGAYDQALKAIDHLASVGGFDDISAFDMRR